MSLLVQVVVVLVLLLLLLFVFTRGLHSLHGDFLQQSSRLRPWWSGVSESARVPVEQTRSGRCRAVDEQGVASPEGLSIQPVQCLPTESEGTHLP